MATARDLAVIAVKGNDYAVMTTWMLESLSMYSLDIEVVIVVHDETTMETLTKRLSLTAQSLVTQIHQVAVDVGTYPAWAWRWFAINNADINYSQWKNIFILDTDLLFLKDPKELFESYTADLWFHKITSLDIDKWKKFLIKREEIEGSNLGMITMLNYIDEFKSQTLPKYHVNGGCFRVPGNVAADIFKMLYVRIIALGPRKMKMTEAVLSMILAEKGLKIWSDQEDVKYYSDGDTVDSRLNSFNLKGYAVKNRNSSTGYQTIKHFYSDQRSQMVTYAYSLGLLNFGQLLFWFFRFSFLFYYPKILKKLIR
jgi:hypothetical protein